jgi:hypothetical protein
LNLHDRRIALVVMEEEFPFSKVLGHIKVF